MRIYFCVEIFTVLRFAQRWLYRAGPFGAVWASAEFQTVKYSMWTRWYSPKIVDQIESDEIAYSGSLLYDVAANFTSLAPVASVAQSRGGVIQTGVKSLVFRDFGINEAGTVVAVEFMLSVSRLARIQDRTVKLWQAEAVGHNRANPQAEDVTVYSGDLAWWQVDTVDHQNPNFGILVDLQPHSQYPSRDSVYIREVKIRVNIA